MTTTLLPTSETFTTYVPNFAYSMIKSFKVDTFHDSSFSTLENEMIAIHPIQFQEYVALEPYIDQVNNSYKHPDFCFMESTNLLSKEELVETLSEKNRLFDGIFENALQRNSYVFHIDSHDLYVLVSEYYCQS